MTTDLIFSVVHVAFASAVGLLALSSAFSFVLGYRHHHTQTRTRDLRLAAANATVWFGHMAALLSSTTISTAVLRASFFMLLMIFLVFIAESAKAERRITESVRASRSQRGGRA